jgi:GT2 family glycosyltransferase
MFWTTPGHTFKERHLKVVESYLFHHPSWEIRFYARHHKDFQDLISGFQRRGYNATLIELNDQFLDDIAARIPEAKVWLDERARWARESPFYLGHLVDLLKPSILYLHAGVYSDLDALLLKPMAIDQWLGLAVDKHNGGRCFAGMDLAFVPKEGPYYEECRWCSGPGKNVYVNSGVIGGEPGSPVMKEALRLGFGKGRYDPQSFNQCGPRSFTLAMRRFPTKTVALPRPLFYPFNYEEVHRLFSSHDGLYLDVLVRETWSMHFFGGTTAKLAVEEGSVMAEAMRRFGLEGAGLKTSAYVEINGDSCAIGSRIRAFNATKADLTISGGGSIKCGHLESDQSELKADNEAELNALLAGCKISCPSECTLSISTDSGGERDLPVFDINAVVTIIIKTVGRMEKVIELVDSIRARYPTVRILVGDDGPDAMRLQGGDKRGFEYVPFEYDVGLSEGRNRLVRRARTPYLQFLDDDFVFGPASDLGQLLCGLATFDVVGGRSEGDEVDYSGNFRVVWGNVNGERKRKLLVKPAPKNKAFGPAPVDIVPNLFMARRGLFKDLSWDPALKLGEHEDFFLRARQRGVRVAIHPQVAFTHHQAVAPSAAYKALRDRWHRFAEVMLRKHGFDELVPFGRSQISLNPLGKAQLRRLSTQLMMPFAAHINWVPLKPFHQYKVQLLKDKQVQTEVLTKACEQAFRDLEPNMQYQVRVFAGNHTDYSSAGPVLSLRTPSFFRRNLVKNPHFDGSTRSWRSSLGTVVLMPLYFPAVDGNVQNMLCSGAFKEHLVGRPSQWAFRNPGSHLDRNYAAAVQIPVALPTDHPIPYEIYQEIPPSRIPAACHEPGVECSLHASAWAKVDRIWGERSQILLDFCIEIEREDEAGLEQRLDPLAWNKFHWQYGQISIGLLKAVDQIKSIKIGVRLGAPRGVILVDDFYLSIRANDSI